jgi:hypothetical protein
MKSKQIGLALILVFIMSSSCVVFAAEPIGEASPAWTFSVNPLGFLQFGPLVQAEIPMDDNSAIFGSIRFHGLGVLSSLINGDDDEVISLASMGIGAGYRYFYRFPDSSNSLYFGGLLEFSWILGSENEGQSYEKEFASKALVIAGNFGYKWRISDNFSMSTGIYAGVFREISSEYWYVSDYSIYSAGERIQEARTTLPFGMVELAFSWDY